MRKAVVVVAVGAACLVAAAAVVNVAFGLAVLGLTLVATGLLADFGDNQ